MPAKTIACRRSDVTKRYSFTRGGRDGRAHFALLPLAAMAAEVELPPRDTYAYWRDQSGNGNHARVISEDAELDSPPFAPSAANDLAARGFERRNRHK